YTRLPAPLRLAGSALRIVVSDQRLGHDVPAFFRRVARSLAPLAGRDMTSWSAEEAIAQYQKLEGELLRNWRTPIVNDFAAMISFGVLCRLTERWLPDLPSSVVNGLLGGETGIRSTEPARRVMGLARRVREDASLQSVFAQENEPRALWKRLESVPAHALFLAGVREYLDEFGDR